MAYVNGVEPAEAGWFTRLVYWFARRNFAKLTGKDRLIESAKVAAHHPRLLRAMGQMEGGLNAARSVPTELKRLTSLQTAMLIGFRSEWTSTLPWAERRAQRTATGRSGHLWGEPGLLRVGKAGPPLHRGADEDTG